MEVITAIDRASELTKVSIKRTETLLRGYMEIKLLLQEKWTVEKKEIMEIITRTLDELK